MTNTIRQILKDSPTCCQLVAFLRDNGNVRDSARGVATWWLRCDEPVAQAALDRLVECGLIAVHTLPSGAVYGLTQNPEVRQWLERFRPGYTAAPRLTRGSSATVVLADLPEDPAEDAPIGATPIGDLLLDTFER